jgi:hypothetical protein
MKTYCSKATVEGIVTVSCKIEYILVCALWCAVHCIQVTMFVMEVSSYIHFALSQCSVCSQYLKKQTDITD